MDLIYIIVIIILSICIIKEQNKLKNIERGLNDLFQKKYIDFKHFKIMDILIKYSKYTSNYLFYNIEKIILNNPFINNDKNKEEIKLNIENQDKKIIEENEISKNINVDNKSGENIDTKEEKRVYIEPQNTYIKENIQPELSYIKESNIKNNKDLNKKEIDFAKILLVLGTIFILTSSILFATTNWKIMSSNVKILTLFISGILQVLISIFYYKKLKIKNISLAFYILGTTILSLTVLSFGYFKLDYNVNLKSWRKI